MYKPNNARPERRYWITVPFAYKLEVWGIMVIFMAVMLAVWFVASLSAGGLVYEYLQSSSRFSK